MYKKERPTILTIYTADPEAPGPPFALPPVQLGSAAPES
jgi:hypothetical protein